MILLWQDRLFAFNAPTQHVGKRTCENICEVLAITSVRIMRTVPTIYLLRLHSYDASLGVDAKTGCVFCLECDDFVYDSAFNDAHNSVSIIAEERHATFQGKSVGLKFTLCNILIIYQMLKENAKRSKLGYQTQKTTLSFKEQLQYLVKVLTFASVSINSLTECSGRRGLWNLGQTCFLNAILQSFVANPLLRNYFLSDKHNEKGCKIKDCTCCEMDKLFTEVRCTRPNR